MTTTATKRVLVDPDTNAEVSSAKKPRYSREIDIRDACLKFISLTHLAFHQKIMKSFASYNNLWVGVQISNIVHSVYSLLRMESKGTQNKLADKMSKTNPTVTNDE